MIFRWIIETLFVAANIGLIVGVAILKNKAVTPAQADFELFQYIIGIGAISIIVAIIFLVAGLLINIKAANLLSLLKRPFTLVCLFNIAAPIIALLFFPRG